jgi:O-antigen ligase
MADKIIPAQNGWRSAMRNFHWDALLWAGIVLLLPVTSFPWVVALVKSDTVAVPSGIFLLVIVLFWLLPGLLQGKSFPRQNLPLLAFVLLAVLVTILSTFTVIPPFKGISPLREQLKSGLTLAVGLCFFLVASTWPVTDRRLRWTLALINLSGLLMIAWSLAQSGAWYAFHRYPAWMRSIQEFFSVGPLYRQRTAGFALEPSWLAHQLNMVYLPYWLAATVRRFSVHRKLWGISLENLLLVAGVTVLGLTLSRVGLLAFLLTVGYLLIRANLMLADRIRTWILHPRNEYMQKHPFQQQLIQTGIFFGLLLLYAGILAGVALVLSKVDPRMQKMFSFSFGQDAILRYADQLAFATRLVYWQAGWNIFNQHPFLGVGLGNAGFYFPQALPAFAWKLVEVHGLAYRGVVLMNIKSIWVRLLAETGIAGFALFCSWMATVWFSARSAEVQKNPLAATIGLGGQLMLIAFLLEGFSVDSFALPYLWISAGLVTAAANACLQDSWLLGDRKVDVDQSIS